MIIIILAALILAAPGPAAAGHERRVERLAAFIAKKQPRAMGYAGQLARRILFEAKRRHLNSAAFAAIGWNESWWWRKTKGTSGEYGVWQLWPAGSATAKAWDRLRVDGELTICGWPDKPWAKLSYSQRRRALHNINVSTAMAALVMRRFLLWCRARHTVRRWRGLGSRGHKRWIDRYAHYNSGLRWPRLGYHWRLRKRSEVIRRVLRGR